MISNIVLSSSSFSYIIETSGIYLIEQWITWPLLTFLRHLSWVSNENPFFVNQDNCKITSLFPISNTSTSVPNLPNIEKKSIPLNHVFTTKSSSKKLPSSYLTLTFLAFLHIPNLHARYFPTTQVLAAVSTTASACSPARWNLTAKRGTYCGVCVMAGAVLLIRFPNPPLNPSP